MADTTKGKYDNFWYGFWMAFKHPVMVYAAGFAGGFIVRSLFI